jgi:hypothetical protein
VFLFPTAKRTIKSPAERTLPAGFHEPGIVRRQPLKRIPELLAVFVGSDSSNRRTARSVAGSAGLSFPLHKLELIHKLYVTDDGVDGGGGEILLFRSELGKEILIAGMHTPKEEHHLKNRGDSNRRAGKRTHVAFEA